MTRVLCCFQRQGRRAIQGSAGQGSVSGAALCCCACFARLAATGVLVASRVGGLVVLVLRERESRYSIRRRGDSTRNRRRATCKTLVAGTAGNAQRDPYILY